MTEQRLLGVNALQMTATCWVLLGVSSVPMGAVRRAVHLCTMQMFALSLCPCCKGTEGGALMGSDRASAQTRALL